MNKKNLAKLALMGLMVASSNQASATGGSVNGSNSGTLLAGGCGGKGGCGSIAMESYSAPNANQYNNRTRCAPPAPAYNGNNYQRSCGASGHGCGAKTTSYPVYNQPVAINDEGYGHNQWSSSEFDEPVPGQPNRYNYQTANAAPASPKAAPARTAPAVPTYPQNAAPAYTQNAAPANTNRSWQNDANRRNWPNYTADNTGNAVVNQTQSETQFLNQLDAQGKQNYWNLDAQARQKAIELSNQGHSASDAIQEASKKAAPATNGAGYYN